MREKNKNSHFNSDIEHEGKTGRFPRIMIEKVFPEIDRGDFPVKRAVGENVIVRANMFTDGHDDICAYLLYKSGEETEWRSVCMQKLGNDLWQGSFPVDTPGIYLYTVKGRTDNFITWLNAVNKKYDAEQDIKVDILVGIQIIDSAAKLAQGDDAKRLKEHARNIKRQRNIAKILALINNKDFISLVQKYPDERDSIIYDKELKVVVERAKALFSSWYEMFPRSCGSGKKHGRFLDCIKYLPEVAKMGFDVLYLPPIHPIGETNRKGKNNSLAPKVDDPGSPWAIGSKRGGHTAIEPGLGTMSGFKKLVKAAAKLDIEIALDMAFQCSPDHPYIKKHPEWFRFRPDDSIQFAENPPKKYEDIVPFDFGSTHWRELWEELKNVVLFWIDKGVRIFRVDNPHTKPFMFWDWLINEIKKDHPDVIFLAEAFTRPNVMYRLAKGGFSQSYTYFTWRNTKREFIEYLTELTRTETAEYFRPNFWPNTPDILPEHLQYGGRPAFIMRAVMASTLSSNYGIYGPAFELCVSEAVPNKEEYLNSEKYEIKSWDRDKDGNLKDLLARLNKIRRENPALQFTRNLKFCETNNDYLLSYYKATDDYSNVILVIVNLDPYHTQAGTLHLPVDALGIEKDRPFLAYDLLSGDKYIWQGTTSYIELDPQVSPAHIIRIKRHMRREQDFDYFM